MHIYLETAKRKVIFYHDKRQHVDRTGEVMSLSQRSRSKRSRKLAGDNEYAKYQVGETLRRIRLSNNMTQTFVANENGLSSGMISLIESNNISASIRTLSKLIDFYGIKMSCLFEDRCGSIKYEVVKKDTRRVIEKINSRDDAGTGYTCELLASDTKDKRMQPFVFTLSDDMEVEKTFIHEGESFVYVMQGTLELFIEETMLELMEGDCVYLEAFLEHRFRTKNGSGVTVFVCCQKNFSMAG